MLWMASGVTSRRFLAAGLACAALFASSFAAAAEAGADSKHKAADPGPAPSVRIDVAPLGYTPPSRFYMVSRLASATLDFIDKDHLLFTFREGGLIPRLPGDPRDDEDQVVCAVVLDIASGKVVQKVEWRMHDHQRYLWAIGGGQFLVRQRNALYLTDSRLELRPYMQFDTALQGISIAPDRKLMMVEFEKFDPPSAESNANGDAPSKAPPTLGDDTLTAPVRRKSTQILILRPHEQTIIARSEARHAIDLPLVENGFLELIEGKQPDKWVIRAKPFTGDSAILGEVKSACTPTLLTLSDNVALTVGCFGGTSDHAITAFSTKGGILWQDRWAPKYIWPTFEFAENGTRFAYGSLQINHAVGTMDPFSDSDVVAQMVGVFDTETGKLELVKTASPVLSAGHNFALTTDGCRFAILREGAIEVYELPPAVVAPAAAVAAAK
jgi:hypothetical protein